MPENLHCCSLVQGMIKAGILASDAGRVRLLRPVGLTKDRDPKKEKRFTIWGSTHHMTRVLEECELAAAGLMTKLGSNEWMPGNLHTGFTTCASKRIMLKKHRIMTSWLSRPEIHGLSSESMSTPGG